MHLFQGHRTSSEPLWHVGLPPLFTQAYIHSLHRFLAHFMICDDYFMISSGFPFQQIGSFVYKGVSSKMIRVSKSFNLQ